MVNPQEQDECASLINFSVSLKSLKLILPSWSIVFPHSARTKHPIKIASQYFSSDASCLFTPEAHLQLYEEEPQSKITFSPFLVIDHLKNHVTCYFL